jgi:hypothetical protein
MNGGLLKDNDRLMNENDKLQAQRDALQDENAKHEIEVGALRSSKSAERNNFKNRLASVMQA